MKNVVSVFSVFLSLSLFFLQGLLSVRTFAGGCNVCSVEENSRACSRCKASYYCSKEHQVQDWPSHKKLCNDVKQYANLAGGVRVDTSTIPNSGRGLFSTKEFKTGDTLAVYYGKRIENNLQSLVRFGSNTYGYNNLIGDSNPPAPHLAGQMANDPYMDDETLGKLLSVDCANIRHENAGDKLILGNLYQEYLRNISGKVKQNAIIDESQGFPRLVAVKPIHPNEEIFVAYGLDYWVGISIQICNRKGLPTAGVEIQKTASQATLQAFEMIKKKFPGLQVETLYNSYLSDQDYVLLSSGLLDQLEWRITSLFERRSSFYMDVVQPVHFDLMVRDLQIHQRLEEISNLSNDEFYDDHNWAKAHPKSKQLMADILAWMKNKNLTPMKFYGAVAEQRYREILNAADDLPAILGLSANQ